MLTTLVNGKYKQLEKDDTLNIFLPLSLQTILLEIYIDIKKNLSEKHKYNKL